MQLGKYSFGIGDRFSQQGVPLLNAIMKASEAGVDITPVWNKSGREHRIIHSDPADTRAMADKAVKTCGWSKPYFVDADHINLENVDPFIKFSDYFTIDVSGYVGKEADMIHIDEFVRKNMKFTGKLVIPGIEYDDYVRKEDLFEIGRKFLLAVQKAEELYSYLADKKGVGNFIIELSMDEVNTPQTPIELFFILSAIGMYDIPIRTIAPKFTGKFNKGVDYEGDIHLFSKEFEKDILILEYAVEEFGFPSDLKISLHSGSDKFSVYPVIRQIINKYDKGIHIKTSGTTWLEELIGLAEAGGKALSLAKSIYKKAYKNKEELCKPYSTSIDIDFDQLPSPVEVNNWESTKFASVLRHIPGNPYYNPDFRQLLHVGFRIAAEYGNEYTDLIKANKEIVGKQVFENIYTRHICRMFGIG